MPTSTILLGILVFLLLLNSMVLFYLVQKFTLYSTLLKGGNNKQVSGQPKKPRGRPPKKKEEA